MAAPRAYRTFADFTREEIRPGLKIGWSLDDIEPASDRDDFDADPFEQMLDEASEAHDRDDFDDD